MDPAPPAEPLEPPAAAEPRAPLDPELLPVIAPEVLPPELAPLVSAAAVMPLCAPELFPEGVVISLDGETVFSVGLRVPVCAGFCVAG